MKAGNKLISVFGNKCPKCQEGKLWKYRNPLKTYFQKESMHETCASCHLKYEREQGFWFGAMYVSYALNTLLFILVWLSTYLISDGAASKMTYVWTILLSGIIFAPVFYYFARLIWINIFVKYDPTSRKIKASS